jgi:hypothetical protein
MSELSRVSQRSDLYLLLERRHRAKDFPIMPRSGAELLGPPESSLILIVSAVSYRRTASRQFLRRSGSRLAHSASIIWTRRVLTFAIAHDFVQVADLIVCGRRRPLRLSSGRCCRLERCLRLHFSLAFRPELLAFLAMQTFCVGLLRAFYRFRRMHAGRFHLLVCCSESCGRCYRQGNCSQAHGE